MFRHVKLGIATLLRLFRSRQSLLFENLALRRQLAMLRRSPRPSGRELRQTFLDSRSASMVRLEAVAPLGHPGNSCPLAGFACIGSWFPEPVDRWEEDRLPGSSRSHLPDGRWQPKLGSAAHSRRAAYARILKFPSERSPPQEAFP